MREETKRGAKRNPDDQREEQQWMKAISLRPGPKGLKWKAWDAVVRLLLVLVREVGVSPEMEDGVFEMLGGWAGSRGDVRSVLEEVNADALWLVEVKEGRVEGLVRPEGVGGWEFRDVGAGYTAR